MDSSVVEWCLRQQHVAENIFSHLKVEQVWRLRDVNFVFSSVVDDYFARARDFHTTAEGRFVSSVFLSFTLALSSIKRVVL